MENSSECGQGESLKFFNLVSTNTSKNDGTIDVNSCIKNKHFIQIDDNIMDASDLQKISVVGNVATFIFPNASYDVEYESNENAKKCLMLYKILGVEFS